MSSLRNVVEALQPDGDGFVIDAPEDWAQGRTLYGGITAALAYEAVKLALGVLGPLRSAQLTFIGPASGRLRFDAELLRRGRSSALIAVTCASEEGPVARAMFVFGGARESAVKHNFLPMPAVTAPDASGPFRKQGASASRGFWNNFETRLGAGSRLLDGEAAAPEFDVWTRLLEPEGADPVTALLAIADCLPPAAMVRFPNPGPISTMTWTVDVLNQPVTAEGWHLLHAASEHAGDGYSMQRMMMWSEAGLPLAVGRQTVAVFV